MTFSKLKKLQFISHQNEQTHPSQMHHSAVHHQNCPRDESEQTTKHLAFNVIMDISKWKSTDSSHAFAFVSTVCHYDVKQNGFSFIKVVFFRSIHILTAHHRLT